MPFPIVPWAAGVATDDLSLYSNANQMYLSQQRTTIGRGNDGQVAPIQTQRAVPTGWPARSASSGTRFHRAGAFFAPSCRLRGRRRARGFPGQRPIDLLDAICL